MGTHTIQARRNDGARERDDVRQVMDAVRRIVQRLRVFSRRAERELGLSGPQLFALQLLADYPDQSVGSLAEGLNALLVEMGAAAAPAPLFFDQEGH